MPGPWEFLQMFMSAEADKYSYRLLPTTLQ